MEPKTELQKNAIANEIKKEREIFQRAIDIQWFNNRIEDSNTSRCLALIQKETEMEKDFKEKTDHAAIVNSRAEKEISLAYEISRAANEEACQLLRRHHLRNTDHQLCELTRKLKGAYVRKDLEQQILHNEYKRLQDKFENANANKIVEDAIYDDSKAVEKEKEALEKKLQYCRELKQQMQNDQQLKENTQKIEKAVQRKQIDDIVKSIEEEHKSKLQKKQQGIARMRKEMLEFEEARKVLKQQEAEAVVAEQKRVEREQAAVSDRTSHVVQARLNKQLAREEMNKKIGAKIAAAEAVREERAELVRQLQLQEYLERGVQQDLAEELHRLTSGAQIRAALDAQNAARAQAAARQERADRARRADTEAKVAAEEEEEREKMRIKREKARQYYLELRTQIEDDEKRKQADRDMEERRAAAVYNYQASWDSEARAEGKIILKEHGHVLTK